MRMIRCAVAAMMLTAIAAPVLPAQTASAAKPALSVLLTARDKNGKLIDDLKAGEVSVLIDDKPAEFARFTRAVDAPLSLGMIVDTGFAQRKQIDAERDALKSFLAALVFERDKSFVLHYDRQVELLQDLTSQRGRLERALEKLNASEVNLNDDEDRPRRRNDDESDDRGGRAGMQRERLQQLRSAVSDAVYLSSTEILRERAGRKVIVVLSGGVNGGGKSTVAEALEEAQRSDVVIYTIYDPGKFELPAELSGNRNGGMNRGGMGAPWPGGGWPGGNRGGAQTGPRIKPEELRNQGKKELEQLSRQSGGHFFEISKKFTLADAFRQIREELESGYFIELNAVGSGRGDYRSVKVEVSRREAIVQSRKEFYAK